ncbi:MAG TPA: SpoIIE family protein phosphatase [Terriglobales bacterium]|nr:SpoIIE family protein phosphatase [Terriglobales bacterium]
MASGGFGLTGTETLMGSAAPTLVFMQGNEQNKITLKKFPYTIGRKTENDLVISDPRVSREHARIVQEPDGYYLLDPGSKHGTFVNGQQIQRQKLKRNDRIEFGVRGEAYALFDPDAAKLGSPSSNLLSQLSVWKPASATSDLETLTLFLEAARKLNTSTVLEEVLVTLIDATLRLTKAERGYVFLREEDGSLTLVAGRNAKGELLADDNTISRSILRDAVSNSSEFLLTDTEDFAKMSARESIVAHNLRTVICIPLRKTQIGAEKTTASDIRGVLYLDSKLLSGKLSAVSHDILRAIATEAASLVENAFLVQAEEAKRRYEQEMNIASGIQQRLMRVTIPDVPFANIEARNISSKEVGGDFYDVIRTENSLTVVVTDVSGKGISAALLASIIQGLLYAQLSNDIPLDHVVDVANRFLCEKVAGEKYATMFIARLFADGKLEYVNCGHVVPLAVLGPDRKELAGGNLPIGLINDVSYQAGSMHLQPGARLIMVTDGVTEAENADGDMFGPERLASLFPGCGGIEEVLSSLAAFCAGTPLNDDCTIVQLTYRGPS